MDCSPPGSLSMRFSRKEYWNGLPFPSPGDFPTQGSNPSLFMSPVLAGGSLPLAPSGKPNSTDVFKSAELFTLNGWTILYMEGFLGDSEVKLSTCNAGDLGSIPGQEDPLEKEMATHSSILAWRIPWTEEPGGLQFTGLQTVRHNWATFFHFILYMNYSSIKLLKKRVFGS